jgi:hypothetical protein
MCSRQRAHKGIHEVLPIKGMEKRQSNRNGFGYFTFRYVVCFYFAQRLTILNHKQLEIAKIVAQ